MFSSILFSSVELPLECKTHKEANDACLLHEIEISANSDHKSNSFVASDLQLFTQTEKNTGTEMRKHDSFTHELNPKESNELHTRLTLAGMALQTSIQYKEMSAGYTTTETCQFLSMNNKLDDLSPEGIESNISDLENACADYESLYNMDDSDLSDFDEVFEATFEPHCLKDDDEMLNDSDIVLLKYANVTNSPKPSRQSIHTLSEPCVDNVVAREWFEQYSKQIVDYETCKSNTSPQTLLCNNCLIGIDSCCCCLDFGRCLKKFLIFDASKATNSIFVAFS